jgi:hypothetical protein
VFFGREGGWNQAPALTPARKNPMPKADFQPYGFRPNQILDQYDENRPLVEIVEGILAMDAETLKRKLPV